MQGSFANRSFVYALNCTTTFMTMAWQVTFIAAVSFLLTPLMFPGHCWLYQLEFDFLKWMKKLLSESFPSMLCALHMDGP